MTTTISKLRTRAELEDLRTKILGRREPNRTCIVTSVGTCGLACGAAEVAEAISSTLRDLGLKDSIDVRTTGCHGFCQIEPVVVIYPDRILYQHVKPEDIPEIVSETVVRGKIIDRLLYQDPATGQKFIHEQDIPFYSKQRRLLLDNNRLINPESIDDYLAVGGYSALAKVLSGRKPEAVIAEVKKSGLRGRGGAGFPAGNKWEMCRKVPSADGIKYIICNSDEGDPGAYMDRSLLEGNPHCVIEGMIIGAYAIGLNHGYVYVRLEYPLAVKNLGVALDQAREKGLLGKNILSSGFDFDIVVSRGGGAFICGEESALIASLEGRAGEARQRPPYPATSGLWGKPTNINNVETWANVPLIINKGADWYRSIGTEGSKGTKIFSLVGKINNTGLVEVPMGIPLREIVYDIGGGVREGKKFKALQSGGPSGGVIPESLIDLKVDFDELSKAGSMMGSGGMVVLDEDTCMVDFARYFVDFLKGESCGKCTPCREGLRQMSEVLTRITEGRGKMSDLPLLERMASAIKDASLCGLGGTSPNPVLTTIKYFRDEYEAHIKRKKCPARVCKALITYSIIEEKCPGCGLCVKGCPAGAITSQGKKQPVLLDQKKCIKCGACYDVCKMNAVLVK